VKSFVKTAAILILAFLALVHFTGFTKDVSTLFGGTKELVGQFQNG
jgi:hypothetical protein